MPLLRPRVREVDVQRREGRRGRGATRTKAFPSSRSTRTFARPARSARTRTIAAYSASISRPKKSRSRFAAAAPRRKRPLPTPISISTGAFRPKIAAKSTTPASALSPGRKIFGGGAVPRLRGPVRGVRGGMTAPDALEGAADGGAAHVRPPALAGSRGRGRRRRRAMRAWQREPDARAEVVRDLVLLDRGEVLGAGDDLDAARRARAAAAADAADRRRASASAAARTVVPAATSARRPSFRKTIFGIRGGR